MNLRGICVTEESLRRVEGVVEEGWEERIDEIAYNRSNRQSNYGTRKSVND
jgi:hypothetical protein